MTLLEREHTEALQAERSPVLKTARLVLRAPRADDAKAITALINDRRVADNMASIPHPYRRKDAKAFIENAKGKPLFVITLVDGQIIGGCGGTYRGNHPELGYWLGVPYWGNGYATEAARALVDYCFGELGYDELLAGARVTNPASRRVLEKCGFQWTGVKLQRVLALNSSAPSDRFRLDRGLWESLRNWGSMQMID
jgi:RimJ/RimL family protein N-acetyltransferase